ncbi:MAG: 4-hydroxy-3-methylbut-2-enyl diphosphate reductase [Eggerthellaceae bacterium]|nr:4-hydroxy-3-methylbut-2-enyl diphosphate reductase [Eggerthellaceae bacterium]
MQVITAEYAGVCWGVKRALDMVEDAASQGGATYTLGPLIHNPQVVDQLETQGVKAIDDAANVSQGTVVLRTHGVHPSVVTTIKSRGLGMVDATCPHVTKAQQTAKRLTEAGYTVLVVGRAAHPEVQGIVGHAHDKAIVVGDVSDIPEHLSDPVGIVVQTTEEVEKLDVIVAELESRGIHPEVHNTICSATSQRQDAAARLAQTVDAMIIIGGKNSSNTTHLYEICKSFCPQSFHIEQLSEIQDGWFEGVERIGVTAGASTPDNQIAPVIEYLQAL